ncbi:MAG: prepilin-type N-terminal cleavage/methylation domain-containing protein [Candidatus Omnitrophica bacterium]|nr:prepilin-type N-terminal cleavage/methylation domain-containing protein [Candidatus Omnitrophota bacterium]
MTRYTLKKTPHSKGFTLIELLIVIAIILILIAIALPNFLEAQLRAKVTKAKSEFRTIETALITYFNDWNSRYPRLPQMDTMLHSYHNLTTPVAYLQTVAFRDPFIGSGKAPSWQGGREDDSYFWSYYLINYETFIPLSMTSGSGGGFSPEMQQLGTFTGFCLDSWGPDRDDTMAPWMPIWYRWQRIGAATVSPGMYHDIHYSPTNGTKSSGDILLYGSYVPPQMVAIGR